MQLDNADHIVGIDCTSMVTAQCKMDVRQELTLLQPLSLELRRGHQATRLVQKDVSVVRYDIKRLVTTDVALETAGFSAFSDASSAQSDAETTLDSDLTQLSLDAAPSQTTVDTVFIVLLVVGALCAAALAPGISKLLTRDPAGQQVPSPDAPKGDVSTRPEATTVEEATLEALRHLTTALAEATRYLRSRNRDRMTRYIQVAGLVVAAGGVVAYFVGKGH